jgi:hypothetical protein
MSVRSDGPAGHGAHAKGSTETNVDSPNHSNGTDEKQALWVPVSQAVTCKRCGRANLAWQQSRSGKWYLCVTRRMRDGKLEAARRQFHHCQPAYTNAHGVQVSDADLPF